MADTNIIPESFRTMCSVAGMAEPAIEKEWLDLSQRAIVDLLTWLLTGPLLTDEQKGKFGKFVSLYGEKEGNMDLGEGGLWGALRPYFGGSQEEEAKKKAEEFLTNHLVTFFADLKSKMTYEENQVVKGIANADSNKRAS